MPASGSLESRLAASVQELAAENSDRIITRITASEAPDGIALEFDDLYTEYIDALDVLPEPGQLESLQALDSALTAMSGAPNAHLWTAPAVRADPLWREVRILASDVLTAFAWPRA